MAMNTAPVFTLTPNVSWTTLTTANTALDGTGTVGTVWTAGADGGYINQIVVKANTTATTSAATLRIYINNGSTNATATNNTLIREYILGVASPGASTPGFNYEFALNIQLPAGYKILAHMANGDDYAIAGIGANY